MEYHYSEYVVQCSTRDCIYSLNCTFGSHLGTLYITESKNSFQDRFNQHLSDIRCTKDTPTNLQRSLAAEEAVMLNKEIANRVIEVHPFAASGWFDATI